jgi:integrase/recombinase XerD
MRDTQRNRKAPIDQLFDAFLLWGNYAPKTRKAYKEAAAVFFKWMQGQGMQGVLGELDPNLVRQWQSALEADNRSPNTLRAYLSALKSFSRYLAEDGITRDKKGQPLDLLATVKIPKAPSKRPEVYPDEDLERVLDAINRNHVQGARNAAFVRLLLDSGLRLNEACQLQVADVDWETGRIHVRSETAKRKKERFTWVGRKTLAELKRYRQHFRPGDTPLPNLFIDQDGGPLTTNAVQCMLARLRKKLGLPRLTAHGFRRSWATAFRRLGVGDLYDLQRMGGWADLEVPQRFYVDTEADASQRASVLDLWETQRRKRQRGRPIQVGDAR